MSEDQKSALSELEKDERKEIVKEAIKEWMESQWAAFGKWTAKGIGAAAFSAGAYWWLTVHGWHK